MAKKKLPKLEITPLGLRIRHFMSLDVEALRRELATAESLVDEAQKSLLGTSEMHEMRARLDALAQTVASIEYFQKKTTWFVEKIEEGGYGKVLPEQIPAFQSHLGQKLEGYAEAIYHSMLEKLGPEHPDVVQVRASRNAHFGAADNEGAPSSGH